MKKIKLVKNIIIISETNHPGLKAVKATGSRVGAIADSCSRDVEKL